MKKQKLFVLFLIVGLSLTLQSCKMLFPNRMFQQGNYEYFSVGQDVVEQYVIQPGDLLTLEIYSREGFDLIDVLPNETGGGNNLSATPRAASVEGVGGRNFLVEQDGYVELPLFGRTYVEGFTENELEDFIEQKCEAIFNEPYAVLQVINRRAFVFKGSEASVISLNQGPTSLIEVIAKSGGIGKDLKAYKIKVIRGDLQNPEVIDVDLSTMEGLQNANLIVQTNDVIYIEQRLRVAGTALKEISPILTTLSSVATIFILVQRL